MSLFFPDLNVWLALTDAGHVHSGDAWRWLELLPKGRKLLFSRYTQIGLLRLLTSTAVMAGQTLTLGEAWRTYDRWLEDPRVSYYPEPRHLEAAFRQATEPLAAQRASKAIGDCFLLASAGELRAILVTFDRALHALARARGQAAVLPLSA